MCPVLCVEDKMEQKALCPPCPTPTGSLGALRAETAEIDLIFVQDLGLVPKRMVTASRPGPLPAAQRKWLGTDFSHIIVSQ